MRFFIVFHPVRQGDLPRQILCLCGCREERGHTSLFISVFGASRVASYLFTHGTASEPMLSDSCEDDSIAAHVAYQPCEGKSPRRQFVTKPDSSAHKNDKAQTVFPLDDTNCLQERPNLGIPSWQGGTEMWQLTVVRWFSWSRLLPSSQPISLLRVGTTTAALKTKPTAPSYLYMPQWKMRREGKRIFSVDNTFICYCFLLFLQSLARYCGALRIPRGRSCAAKPLVPIGSLEL